MQRLGVRQRMFLGEGGIWLVDASSRGVGRLGDGCSEEEEEEVRTTVQLIRNRETAETLAGSDLCCRHAVEPGPSSSACCVVGCNRLSPLVP